MRKAVSIQWRKFGKCREVYRKKNNDLVPQFKIITANIFHFFAVLNCHFPKMPSNVNILGFDIYI